MAVALSSGTVQRSSLERATVDTTLQEKAIAHPIGRAASASIFWIRKIVFRPFTRRFSTLWKRGY